MTHDSVLADEAAGFRVDGSANFGPRNVHVNVNNLLAISKLDFDNSGEPGPQAVHVHAAVSGPAVQDKHCLTLRSSPRLDLTRTARATVRAAVLSMHLLQWARPPPLWLPATMHTLPILTCTRAAMHTGGTSASEELRADPDRRYGMHRPWRCVAVAPQPPLDSHPAPYSTEHPTTHADPRAAR